MSDTSFIQAKKQEYGSRLVILGHHYQNDAIMRHVDYSGDSLELARKIGKLDAQYIIFCGVWFMAESAALLKSSKQSVYTPETSASCAMADMLTARQLRNVLNTLQANGKNIIPLAYVNSSLEVKAVVGEAGGAVCTSANAKIMLDWAMRQGDAVLFLPDMHLGNNTANALNIPLPKRELINTTSLAPKPDTKLFLWPGYCPVHDLYSTKHIQDIKEKDPTALIVVHPESPPAVVAASDGFGSTSFLIQYAKEAKTGANIYIGTEANLVNRLAQTYAPEKSINHLLPVYCEDMAKISEAKLAHLLKNLEQTKAVEIDMLLAEPARLALQRMLKACS